MRILVASSSPPDRGSGINAYCLSLSEALVGEGYEVYFLSPTPEEDSWLKQHCIVHVPSDQDDDPLLAAIALNQYIRESGIEGVINNDNSLLQSIAPLVDCPFIAVGHMGKSSVAKLACFNIDWVDHVIAISSDMQRVFTNRYGVPVEKCPVVHNGVIDPGKRANIKSALATFDTPIEIVFGGGFSANKGGDLVERLLHQLGPKIEYVRIHWFGSVPENIQRRLCNWPNISFHGRVLRHEFHAVLSAADILLLPSRAEGCPMVLLEAMSLGVVPIVSDGLGAMRWLVDNGREGYVCSLSCWAQQAAACINFLSQHEATLEVMKHAARQRYEKELRIEYVAQRLVELLAQPTVDRKYKPAKATILRWHRPLIAGTDRAPFIDRLAIRAGWLRRAGRIRVNGKQSGSYEG